MIIGKPKVKYGLDKREASNSSRSNPVPKKPLAIFGGDQDSDDDVEKDIQRQAAKKVAQKKVEGQLAAALEEDPSIFDYDGVYDGMKQQKQDQSRAVGMDKKPKYIATLLHKAKEREQEQEIIRERRLQKEREKEDGQFADKDKFVTGAYKKKLAEKAKWLAEEEERERREARDDVTKKGDLSDFYRNLLSQNTAFGAPGRAATPSVPAATAVTSPAGAASVRAGPAAAAAPLVRQPPLVDSARGAAAASLPVSSVVPGGSPSGHEVATREGDDARGPRSLVDKCREAEASVGGGLDEEQGGTDEPAHTQGAAPQGIPLEPVTAGGRSDAVSARQGAVGSTESATARKRNDADAVQAARERYLARKKARGESS